MCCLLSGLLTACLGAGVSTADITQVRASFGPLGPERAENRFLPGDIVFLSFDIGGLQPDKAGLFRYRVRLAVQDAREKTLFEDAQDVPSVGTVMGGKVRHTVQYAIDHGQEAGACKIRIGVTDLAAPMKTETTTTYDFHVLPPTLGLVRFHASLDRFGQTPVPGVGVVGQMLTFHMTALGFKPDRKLGEGSITIEFQLLDAQDRPVNNKPLVSEFKALPSDTAFVPLRFDLLLQRPGVFKMVYKLTDNVEKKTATLSVPVQVLDGVGK